MTLNNELVLNVIIILTTTKKYQITFCVNIKKKKYETDILVNGSRIRVNSGE